MANGRCITLAAACLLAAAAILAGCESEVIDTGLPSMVRSVELMDGNMVLEPVGIQVVGDSLFVSYRGIAGLDIYDLDLAHLGRIPLVTPDVVMPTSFAVNDSQIVVCDHAKGAVVIYDRNGNFVGSFGMLPDGQTRLVPRGLALYRGVAYVADMRLRRVLAISTIGTAGVVDLGELILQIPSRDDAEVGAPTAVFVTPDGRLLVGDAAAGRVRAFTCDGQSIYAFDSPPDGAAISAQGFAMDDVPDPSLRDPHSVDPSGVRGLGRIHVADGAGGVVHMFNPLGDYVASYPQQDRLGDPSDIAIAPDAGRIYVADAGARRVHIFSYGGPVQ